VIILGVRDDVRGEQNWLKASTPVTLGDVLKRFPKIRSGLSKGDKDGAHWHRTIRDAAKSMGLRETTLTNGAAFNAPSLHRGARFIPTASFKPKSKLEEWLQDERLHGLIQHESRAHMPGDLVRYHYSAEVAKQSARSPKLEEWPSTLRPSHKNVRIDAKTGAMRVSGFSDRFKVQLWHEPASTVTCHISKDGHYYIHPDPAQCRSLTVREAARIQTFPDNYFFCGNRTQQFHQVGNAVPPFIAVQLAEIVAKLLKTSERASR
jgi:DNA (cytosine-5)-methyltransferase 1